MDIKSSIEQIISNNIGIGETENRLDYLVHNTSELADEIVKLFDIPVVVCRCCGNNTPEICSSCVSDIAQETGDAAYNSR